MEKAKINTRDIALNVLMDIEVNNTFSNLALTKALKKNQFSDKQDRAFISRLVEGVIERQITLDYIVDQFSKTKVKKCKPLIKSLLRMGTYQIMYMDKVPDSAACNECVKLARSHGFSSLSGFVNGVLRSISRNKESIHFPNVNDKSAYYSIKYSIPEWLCEKIIADYPDCFDKIFEGCFEDRKTTIRVNETKISKQELKKLLEEAGVEVSDGYYADKAILIDGYDFIRKLPGYRQGYFSVQDESSMCAVKAAGIKKGDTVIDVCAAPGGKTTLAAEYLDGEGLVISMDIAQDKLETIEENVDRLGLTDLVEVKQNDASVMNDELIEKADVLIADVLCSGLGIIGRKNDIKYKLSEEQLASLVNEQRKILDTVVKYIKPEGTLLYSTCTINPMENKGNVDYIVKNYPEFKLAEERLFIQGVDKCDGFYYAVLKKNV